MADSLDKQRRSALMARVRSRGTAPELAVRKRLHAAGLRFRLHRRDLPGRPDVVLPRLKTAVFVHGCFWHGHEGCDRGRRRPAANADFWNAKLAENRARDARAARLLEEAGWRVLTVWECQTKRPDALEAALAPLIGPGGRA